MTEAELYKKVKEIPIREVIQKRINRVGYDSYLCPFHDDHTPKNFHINDEWNTFKCFCCGAKGNAIKFIADYDNISRQEAVQRIAKEFKLTSGEITYSPIKKNYERKKSKKKEVQTLSKIYTIFSNISEIMGNPRLNEEHYNHLKNERMLSDDEIEAGGYFTFPNLRVLRALLKEFEKNGINRYELNGVPGFFYDTVSCGWKFVNLKNNSGIGIPLKDKDGYITGIQIRLDKKTKAGKYIWFSSSFASSGSAIYGSSPGSPISLYYPDKKKYNTLFITEGHFKGYQIAKHFKSTAISVQGVGNWVEIPDFLKNQSMKNIFISFDSDFIYKEGVLIQLMKMIEGIINYQPRSDMAIVGHEILLAMANKKKATLRQNYKEEIKRYFEELEIAVNKYDISLYIAYWDDKYGKGIDDVILSGNKSELHSIKYEDILPCLFQYLVSIDIYRERRQKKLQVPLRNIKVSERVRKLLYNNFFKKLQK